MRKELDKLGLPPSVLNMLEGFPVIPPSFPNANQDKYLDSPDEEDERILPGGPSSSSLLRLREKKIQTDLESLLQEVRRLTYLVESANVTMNSWGAVINTISSAIASYESLTGSAGIVDFYQPGAGVTNKTNSIDIRVSSHSRR